MFDIVCVGSLCSDFPAGSVDYLPASVAEPLDQHASLPV